MDVLLTISWIFLGIGLLSSIIIYVDINMGRYQGMPIMNVCWPITALYSGPIALFMYFKYGRPKKMKMDHSKMKAQHGSHSGHSKHKMKHKPSWVQIYISSTHCAFILLWSIFIFLGRPYLKYINRAIGPEYNAVIGSAYIHNGHSLITAHVDILHR